LLLTFKYCFIQPHGHTTSLKLICWELTGVLNKQRVWVWHSPQTQKGPSRVMPSICRLDWHSLSCRSGQDAVLFPRITVSRPLPWESPLHLVLLWYIINSLEVGSAGVSPSERPAYLDPALSMFCLLSVVFPTSPVTLRFLGQARVERKRPQTEILLPSPSK
jgi:hypothetical protein